MISDADYKFHERDPNDDTWSETTFVIFSVPELAISGKSMCSPAPIWAFAIATSKFTKAYVCTLGNCTIMTRKCICAVQKISLISPSQMV